MKTEKSGASPRALTAATVSILSLAALIVFTLGAAARTLHGQEMGPGERGDFGDRASEFSDLGDAVSELSELSDYIAMPETLMYKLRAGEKGVLVVDVRAPEKYDRGRIRGAANYPWKGGVFLSIYGSLPKDREIFLVSEDGGFGLEALRVLVDAGFNRAYCVEGGMQNWPYTDLVERP